MPEQLHKDLEELIPEVRKLAARVKIWRSIVAALVVISLTLALLIWREYATQNCIKSWAVNTTQRAELLAGPGNARVSKLLRAFYLAAVAEKSTQAAKAADVAILDKLREEFPGLPSHKKAETMTDGAIEADIKLIDALHTNDRYNRLFHNNPIPKTNFDCSLV